MAAKDANMGREDAALLNQLKEGNIAAFNMLYDKYWQTVYSAAFKRLSNADQAKDITQDFFLQLWLRRQELHILHLPAYIYTSVRNRVLNVLEAEKKFLPFAELLLEELPAGEQADALTHRNELLEAYNTLVDTLPPARQAIFRLRYNDGVSSEEIALQLNISRKTVQNQLGKALASLRASLTQITTWLFV